MYNYMTSLHTPERPLIYIYYFFLSLSLTRSHTQMFIHEHSSSSKDGLHVRLASERQRRQRAIEASHGDINLINMMK